MIKLFNATLALFSLVIWNISFRNHKVVVIETHIFGHAILEAGLLNKHLRNIDLKSAHYVISKKSANDFLTKSIVNELKKIGIRGGKLAAKALHGQDIVNNRTKVKRRILLIDFQEDLTSLCASNLEPKDLPHFDFNKNLKLERAYNRKTILLMNRSAAYKKIQESPELHAYRNFDFEVISSAITKVDDKDIDFIRIGVPDGLSTKNERILDARTELQRNAELDIKIQTEAFAYFGADSGPAWLAHCMNKSVAYINMIPLNQDSPTEPKKLIVIPKILFWEKEARVLTLAEMLSPEISAIRNTAEYSRHGIKPINNSFEDVSYFLSDWIDMLLGISNCVDEEQMKFIRSTHKLPNLPSIHRRFLQNHPELLPV